MLFLKGPAAVLQRATLQNLVPPQVLAFLSAKLGPIWRGMEPKMTPFDPIVVHTAWLSVQGSQSKHAPSRMPRVLDTFTFLWEQPLNSRHNRPGPCFDFKRVRCYLGINCRAGIHPPGPCIIGRLFLFRALSLYRWGHSPGKRSPNQSFDNHILSLCSSRHISCCRNVAHLNSIQTLVAETIENHSYRRNTHEVEVLWARSGRETERAKQLERYLVAADAQVKRYHWQETKHPHW